MITVKVSTYKIPAEAYRDSLIKSAKAKWIIKKGTTKLHETVFCAVCNAPLIAYIGNRRKYVALKAYMGLKTPNGEQLYICSRKDICMRYLDHHENTGYVTIKKVSDLHEC